MTLSPLNRNLTFSRETLDQIAQKYSVLRLALFGSVLREDFSPSSDVDVLVEFQTNHMPGFFGLVALEKELSGALGGHKVDLRTSHELSPLFRDQVLKEAREIYSV